MSNLKLHDAARWAARRGIPLLPRVLGRLVRLLYSCEISYRADIHPTVVFAHKGLGVVVGHDAIIGAETRISQNVTVGGRGGRTTDGRSNRIIGRGVIAGAGACILGPVKVGDEASIGANAVVLEDVSARSIAVGVPARIVERVATPLDSFSARTR